MADDTKNDNTDNTDASSNADTESKSTSGPTFKEAPDPLAGVKKGASDAMASMDGKTVSMKTYVGSIIAVIVLMMLARCGG